jgi:hypothetical protein
MKKSIISFFKWFINLFKKAKPTIQEVTTQIVDTVSNHSRPIPTHNNRRKTNGRFIQAINMGMADKFIYHY